MTIDNDATDYQFSTHKRNKYDTRHELSRERKRNQEATKIKKHKLPESKQKQNKYNYASNSQAKAH